MTANAIAGSYQRTPASIASEPFLAAAFVRSHDQRIRTPDSDNEKTRCSMFALHPRNSRLIPP
jgi:hypothetical protein